MEPSHLPCSSLTHPAAILTPSIGVLRWIRAKAGLLDGITDRAVLLVSLWTKNEEQLSRPCSRRPKVVVSPKSTKGAIHMGFFHVKPLLSLSENHSP